MFLNLYTPAEWCREYGIDVRDWDGWLDSGAPPINNPLGLSEFYRRITQCAADIGDDVHERINADLAKQRAARKPAVMAWLDRPARRPMCAGRTLRIVREVPWPEWHLVPLAAEIKPGAIVHEYRGHTYGCMTADEIAVSLEPGVAPFWGVPRDAVEDVNDNHEEN